VVTVELWSAVSLVRGRPCAVSSGKPGSERWTGVTLAAGTWHRLTLGW